MVKNKIKKYILAVSATSILLCGCAQKQEERPKTIEAVFNTMSAMEPNAALLYASSNSTEVNGYAKATYIAKSDNEFELDIAYGDSEASATYLTSVFLDKDTIYINARSVLDRFMNGLTVPGEYLKLSTADIQQLQGMTGVTIDTNVTSSMTSIERKNFNSATMNLLRGIIGEFSKESGCVAVNNGMVNIRMDESNRKAVWDAIAIIDFNAYLERYAMELKAIPSAEKMGVMVEQYAPYANAYRDYYLEALRKENITGIISFGVTSTKATKTVTVNGIDLNIQLHRNEDTYNFEMKSYENQKASYRLPSSVCSLQDLLETFGLVGE